MVQYETGEEVLYNGAGFDAEIDNKRALRARIIKGYCVYEIELLGDGNKKGKTIRICDSSDSRVLQKGPASPNNECPSPEVMHLMPKFWDLEEEVSSFEEQGPSDSDSIRVVQPAIKLCNENGQLRLWVGYTYAISTNKPMKENNSYSFKGHQLIQGSLCKYEADKANMLRVNFSNQASAEKFYDTFAEMSGFDRIKKAWAHDSSASQLEWISPTINRQKNPPKINFRFYDSPFVNHDEEDMKSSRSSLEIDNDRIGTQYSSAEKLRHLLRRESEVPTIVVDGYRSSELGYARSITSNLLSLSVARSSMEGSGSLSKSTLPTQASTSLLDPMSQSPATSDIWEDDKSPCTRSTRTLAFAVTK